MIRAGALLALLGLLLVTGCSLRKEEGCAQKTGDGLCAYTNDMEAANAG